MQKDYLINSLLKGKTLLDYTSLLSPGENERNERILLKYFG